MDVVAQHTVSQLDDLVRFGEYARGLFAQLPSRKSVKKAIKSGRLLLNNAIVEEGRYIKKGDVISLCAAIQKLPVLELELEVCYEDEYLAIVYKPAGIAVSGYQKRTLAMALPFNLSISNKLDALTQPKPVHRLDLPTRGLLLIAKTAFASMALGELFASGKIQKRYQAVVFGCPGSKGVYDEPLHDKNAKTAFECLETIDSSRSGRLSLLNLYPKTGRKHQLRLHLSQAGCPIVGDKQYGCLKKLPLHKGLFLAACGLQFQHPILEESINIQLDTPHKFRAMLDREKRLYCES